MLRHLLTLFLLELCLASVLPQESMSEYPDCDCTGNFVKPDRSVYYEYICGDRRLGPRVLPRKLPLGAFVDSYDRFGGLTPNEFLERWWNHTGTGYKYPDHNGFQLDEGNLPMSANMTLTPGMLVDRFGDAGGRYLSPASAPFSQRALHPGNLDTPPSFPEFPNNYRVYRVMKNITVIAGPIRPWFGQPGLGTQFFLGDNVNVWKYIKDDSLLPLNPQGLVEINPGCKFERMDLK
ncbi:hypothetical protein CEP54_012635 [Fusarium duplospermum]|uniref:TNT domain-containing protein n=1 Tax=Fusarium duplospermum TaxID=1325734 RepID=A0A428P7I3_9HYPO|nr:hypothetical protein CEP54_012635 [Fusarium duplospermum]